MQSTMKVRQASLGTRGIPSCAQSKVSDLFTTKVGKVVIGRVQVNPKFPAVPVDADKMTLLMPLIFDAWLAVGMREIRLITRPAAKLVTGTAVRLKVVAVSEVTFIVALAAVDPTAV